MHTPTVAKSIYAKPKYLIIMFCTNPNIERFHPKQISNYNSLES